MNGKVLIVIPARYASRRFPGKPLVPLLGKPLIVWVWERARHIPLANEVLVATDHQEIARAVQKAGGKAVMTPADLPSGSDRVGWVARENNADIVVNLQGDEPWVDVEVVNRAIAFIRENREIPVATLGKKVQDKAVWENPNVVKVLTDLQGRALYFTRQPIPFFRDSAFHPLPRLYQHIGVYIFRKEFLLQYLQWEPTDWERAEQLEQLRILEHGYPIQVLETQQPALGVDTREDLEKVTALLMNSKEKWKDERYQTD